MKFLFAIIVFLLFSHFVWGQTENRLEGKWQVERAHRGDSTLYPLVNNPLIVYIKDSLLRYHLAVNNCMTNISYSKDSVKVTGGFVCTQVCCEEPSEIYKHFWFSGKYKMLDNDSSLIFENRNGSVLLKRLE